MSDIKLFKFSNGTAVPLATELTELEKHIQVAFERNLETLLGVKLLASEFSTSHGGRMDTLGIDEDNCPVIIEYKRSKSENVINQGLFYLDWLMDHKAEFELLVTDQIGRETARNIAWSAPRLICIAADFSKYDEHAVKQINRNIELIRFKKFSNDMLVIELLTAQSASSTTQELSPSNKASVYKTVTSYLDQSDDELKALFSQVRDALLSLGEDVQEKTLKFYFAFKRIKNFACVEVKPVERKILVYLKVKPDEDLTSQPNIRDVKDIGHFGTGNLEVTIRSQEDLEKYSYLFGISYENS
ncbi:Endonuclease NucS [Aquimixticola soesokkakensis]|uniref:Endonuclease NucS n=1 Tax=Aquimixticola soesokkakensis TaxID=1519096 RepID=A0A1Y5RMU2_9RHOB|nr:DUF5655 domain-containing protein [Aquimixticola soesokkakensis]SLN21005.1 Endonuclease NucS [Aquimixticola soesokkakensis]